MAKKLPTKKTALSPLQERAEAYMQDDIELMKKHHITKKVVVFFPKHQSTPFLGRIALKLLTICSAQIDIRFLNQK
jgi:hypothetical protein